MFRLTLVAAAFAALPLFATAATITPVSQSQIRVLAIQVDPLSSPERRGVAPLFLASGPAALKQNILGIDLAAVETALRNGHATWSPLGVDAQTGLTRSLALVKAEFLPDLSEQAFDEGKPDLGLGDDYSPDRFIIGP